MGEAEQSPRTATGTGGRSSPAHRHPAHDAGRGSDDLLYEFVRVKQTGPERRED